MGIGDEKDKDDLREGGGVKKVKKRRDKRWINLISCSGGAFIAIWLGVKFLCKFQGRKIEHFLRAKVTTPSDPITSLMSARAFNFSCSQPEVSDFDEPMSYNFAP